MPEFQAKPIEAQQWQPGVPIAGVVEETKVAKGSDPEVTHGLMLVLGVPPLQLKDAAGKPTRAKVNDTISAGRGHLETSDGHTELVLPGDWIVTDSTGVRVLSDGEFQAQYQAAK